MDTKALRQKILDLAIRGKLVPQDPNDEPASVLLERIRAQKQQMVREGKLKSKDIKDDTVIFVGEDNLHYEKFADDSAKCIEDEIPFELPDGWAWLRLQSFIDFIGGSQPPKSTFEYSPSDDNIRLIQIRDYKTDKFMTFIPRDKARRFCSKNDVMIGRYGPPIFQILRGLEGSYNVALMKAVADPQIMLNDYLFYLLQDGELLRMLESLSDRTCGQDGINMYELNRYIVGIPPLNEQRRIIDFIDKAVPLVESVTKLKEEMSALIFQAKSKILDMAIRGRLVPQDPADEPASLLLERIRAEKGELIKQGKIKRDKKESFIFRGDDNSYYEKIEDTIICINDIIPFELPDGWAWARGYSCFSGMESKRPAGVDFDYIDIDSIDNRNHVITEPKHMAVHDAPSRASRAVHAGSVLFSLVRPYLQNIAFIPQEYSNCIASTGFYVCNTSGALIPEFMFSLMLSPYVVNGLNQFMKGDNSPSISKDDLENWLYPIPPIAEQKRSLIHVHKVLQQIGLVTSSLS